MRRWRCILGRENHVCKGPELRESRGHTVNLKTSGIEDTLRWRETYEMKLLRAARAEAKRPLSQHGGLDAIVRSRRLSAGKLQEQICVLESPFSRPCAEELKEAGRRESGRRRWASSRDGKTATQTGSQVETGRGLEGGGAGPRRGRGGRLLA